MQITEQKGDNQITLKVEGRIDANTSAKLQEAVLLAFQKTVNIVLDFEKVDYISSAGLRVLLIGQKTAASKSGSMVLKQVKEEVMMVIKMSGFDKILKVDL